MPLVVYFPPKCKTEAQYYMNPDTRSIVWPTSTRAVHTGRKPISRTIGQHCLEPRRRVTTMEVASLLQMQARWAAADGTIYVLQPAKWKPQG